MAKYKGVPRTKNNQVEYRRQIEERNRRIYEARVIDKKTLEEVEKEFRVSRSTIFNVVKEQEQKFIGRHDYKVEEIKRDHTERLEWIYEQAKEAFEKSKRTAVTIQETVNSERVKQEAMAEDRQPPEDKVVTTKKRQTGEAAYLGTMMKALEDIRQIWGANEPEKLQVGGQININGSATPVLTPAELKQRIDQRLLELHRQQQERTITIPAANITQQTVVDHSDLYDL